MTLQKALFYVYNNTNLNFAHPTKTVIALNFLFIRSLTFFIYKLESTLYYD